MNILTRWAYKPAKWWQFWMPQSDFIGGLLMGAAVCLIVGILYWVLI